MDFSSIYSFKNISIALIAYLFGAIPSALLIIKLLLGKDIRNTGSGNVGAMNSYETSGKKWVGIAVFFMDALKGTIPVLIAAYWTNEKFQAMAIAATFAVIGHNFNIFLKFKGGRGLATGVGAFAVINPIVIFHWALMWVLGWFVIKKNVHVANTFATIAAPIILFSTPDAILIPTSVIKIYDLLELKIFTAVICFVILLRHIEPIRELINSDYKGQGNKDNKTQEK